MSDFQHRLRTASSGGLKEVPPLAAAESPGGLPSRTRTRDAAAANPRVTRRNTEAHAQRLCRGNVIKLGWFEVTIRDTFAPRPANSRGEPLTAEQVLHMETVEDAWIETSARIYRKKTTVAIAQDEKEDTSFQSVETAEEPAPPRARCFVVLGADGMLALYDDEDQEGGAGGRDDDGGMKDSGITIQESHEDNAAFMRRGSSNDLASLVKDGPSHPLGLQSQTSALHLGPSSATMNVPLREVSVTLEHRQKEQSQQNGAGGRKGTRKTTTAVLVLTGPAVTLELAPEKSPEENLPSSSFEVGHT